MTKKNNISKREALEFHSNGIPGKVSLLPTKPLMTQRDLSLAYSPGVAFPCLEISKDPQLSYDYTAKANSVAVISNGTAVLGLGDLGALASKPVMEGKAVLFKRFADIDAVDIEVDTKDPDQFINCVRYLGPTWGGINLEDIKSPDCFIIEKKLRELIDVPVFHDDQHGTAIIVLAALINAVFLTKKDFKKIKIVSNGAGAASLACMELLSVMGVPKNNIILCDSGGVVYKGRKDGMNPWKEKHAVETKDRSLADAMSGADVFVGLSVKDVVSQDMVKSMAKNPIIFVLANPDPEIKPEKIKEVRDDAIIATGRSDYPNQVNNVMGFPYIFRGALDVRAKNINDEMKIAAANALAELAREPVPNEVSDAYGGKELAFGSEYIIPVPFDNRLIQTVPIAVAKAAIESGVARKKIKDFDIYKNELIYRLNPAANMLNIVFEKARSKSKRIIFADGEEPAVIKAAMAIYDNGTGIPVLVGREEKIFEAVDTFSTRDSLKGIEITNAKLAKNTDKYIEFFYKKLQRRGMLKRDCVRLVKGDRNIFSACMLEYGDGDALIAGYTRNYKTTLGDIFKVFKNKKGEEVFGLSIIVNPHKTVFVADSTVNIAPSAEQLATIAIQSAAKAKEFGEIPRVAFLSFSSFGSSKTYERTVNIREAVSILDKNKNIDFEYEGEMSVDDALDPNMKNQYPFSRLSGPANILIMPSLHAAHISSKMLKELGGGAFIGPMLLGFSRSVQILHTDAAVEDIINMAAIAAAYS
ncbi:MAG: NADP-dependent malic enzyme [Alphaproteobacteria bacterium]|nr:NADP-dependent malic enzyme [Alphaproteobacteria bacterium]